VIRRGVNPIPSLPTDNLYKFCAVAGLIAIIIAGLTMFQAWRDILGNQFSIENQAFEQRSKELLIRMGEDSSKPWWIPTDETPEEAARRKQLKDEAERMKPHYEKAKKQLEADMEKLNSERYEFSIVGRFAVGFALVGFIAGIYGFRNWRAIQLKQDELLELELTKQKARAHAKHSRSVGTRQRRPNDS
jgi:hypothetical protein